MRWHTHTNKSNTLISHGCFQYALGCEAVASSPAVVHLLQRTKGRSLMSDRGSLRLPHYLWQSHLLLILCSLLSVALMEQHRSSSAVSPAQEELCVTAMCVYVMHLLISIEYITA